MISRIKAALQQILEDGPVDTDLGICGNLYEILEDDHKLYCYDFVFFNCVGWHGIANPQDWPIYVACKMTGAFRGPNKWSGDAGEFRKSLVKHLIYVIDNNHVNHSHREE